MSNREDKEIKGLVESAAECADFLLEARRVEVIAHIDADGITSASIASAALDRAGVEHGVHFLKKLDPLAVGRINRCSSAAVWLVDLGSGSYNTLDHEGLCISDHHLPSFSGQTSLSAYSGRHVNPHLHGKDGSVEICGAGVTYLIATQIDPVNRDLAPLAIVGAVGDFQDSGECRLKGLNRYILEDGEELGLVKGVKDIRLFGRETRPLALMLQYSSDPFLPGLTGMYSNCVDTLQTLGLIPEGGKEREEGGEYSERDRKWIDLDQEERKRLASWLCEFLLHSGMGSKAVRRLIGEVYILPMEEEGTELHDAKEFATLLNACGRYGKGRLGMDVCKGDRGDRLQEALRMLRSHRQYLSESISLLVDTNSDESTDRLPDQVGGNGIAIVPFRENLRFFQADERIPETIVGIVAGMYLGSNQGIADRPLIGMAPTQDDPEKVKVSARGTREMVRCGLDLARAMRMASEKVGGVGGGHAIAAGATIDRGREEEFLEELERIVGDQMGGSRRGA